MKTLISRKYLVALLVMSAMIPTIVFGLVLGPSNLGMFGYPQHNCSPPYSKPYKPYSFDSQWEVDNYNAEVEAYNYEIGIYFDCINEYLEAANNDIKRISERMDEAIDEANSL